MKKGHKSIDMNQSIYIDVDYQKQVQVVRLILSLDEQEMMSLWAGPKNCPQSVTLSNVVEFICRQSVVKTGIDRKKF